jgi:hypothetical protein
MRSFHPLLFAALVLIVPACSGDINGSTPIFTDTFSGTFPAPNWTNPTTTGTATMQTAGGLLAVKTTSASATATTTTQMAFTNPNLTISVQMNIQSSGLQATGTIELLNGSSTVVASVSWDSAASTITYKIQTTSLVIPAVPGNYGILNSFQFTVDSSGKATWSLGNTPVNTPVAIPAGPLTLRIGASFGAGSSWPEIDFDNVAVSSP